MSAKIFPRQHPDTEIPTVPTLRQKDLMREERNMAFHREFVIFSYISYISFLRFSSVSGRTLSTWYPDVSDMAVLRHNHSITIK